MIEDDPDFLLDHLLNGPMDLFYGKFFDVVSANTPEQRSAWIWQKSRAIREKMFNCTEEEDGVVIIGPCCLSNHTDPVTIEIIMHNMRFDCDNVIKGIIDCVDRAGVMLDDRQVVKIEASKRKNAYTPHVAVTVQTVRKRNPCQVG